MLPLELDGSARRVVSAFIFSASVLSMPAASFVAVSTKRKRTKRRSGDRVPEPRRIGRQDPSWMRRAGLGST